MEEGPQAKWLAKFLGLDPNISRTSVATQHRQQLFCYCSTRLLLLTTCVDIVIVFGF